MPSSNMQRTFRWLEQKGWKYWVVERHNPFSNKKTDLFHIIDVIALSQKSVIGVQSCGSDFMPHKRKLMEDEQYYTKLWLSTKGTKLYLIGWRKLVMKGTLHRRKFYPRIAQIRLKKGKLVFKEYPLVKE